MSFELKKKDLAELLPGNNDVDQWHSALVQILPKYGINTARRMAHFISQCAHESGSFRTLTENLNYSEKALNAVFGRYFGPAPKRNAAEYARNPEKIANYVYMDEYRRYKMGNVKDGDGWLFRGRGLKQLTGRDNYTAFGKSIGMCAEDAVAYVATNAGAVESACWFWDNNNLNSIADTDDVVKMTKRINGGRIGLADRQSRYVKALRVLGTNISLDEVDENDNDDIEIDDIGVLRRGSRGEGVKLMQKALKITADGIFGRGTERILKSWQSANVLYADGIAGPKTLALLLG